jgi:cytochrome c oxidase subunit 1
MQAVHSSQRNASPLSFPRLAMLNSERWLIGAHILVALIALPPGILMGPFEVFRRSPTFMELVPDWTIPFFSYYYQALTVHGVMNALFFTTIFIVGHSYFVMQRSLQRPLWNIWVAWGAFALMVLGLLFSAYSIMIKQSSVLYTFYPPLIAKPSFYIGLVLLVVGTWLVSLNLFKTYAGWRRDNPGVRCPLGVFGVMMNFVMWVIATISVATLILVMLLPASLGIIDKTDPQMARVLFWFFGHPLVYFWLFPAYVSWYSMLPKQAGGKLFSDPLGRIAMIMLGVFSVPVGVHHLLADPGVSEMAKFVHTTFTFMVAAPSLLTAFNIGAALENAGRRRGATGLFQWLWKQDWKNPIVSAQLAALIIFVAGGFSGMIQASFTLNIALHNTSWVPAHFHMTLASAATLTYISIIYWIVPMIRGSGLWSRRMALTQIGLWTVGMIIFGHGMGAAGIAGVPRRTDLGAAPYVNEAASIWLDTTAVGAVLLLISAILLYVNVIGTLVGSKKPVEHEPPIDTEGDPKAPLWFENWWLWFAVMAILGLLAWAPLFLEGFYYNAPNFGPTGLPIR